MACSMGKSWSSTLPADGLSRLRRMPLHAEADAWLSRSTIRTGRRGDASAAARLTAIVVLPTPPLLLTTATITGDFSVIPERSFLSDGCNSSTRGRHPRPFDTVLDARASPPHGLGCPFHTSRRRRRDGMASLVQTEH